MPLDSNLFVLLVRPRQDSSSSIDFIIDGTPDSQVLYSAHKDPTTSILTLYDPLTSVPYGTLFQPPPSLPNATTPNPKIRSIQLESPSTTTLFRNSGGLQRGWEWSFEWQETKYVWGRDVVGLLGSERGYTLSVSRKPDPNYPVVTFHPKKKGGSIEILDYNFARVEPAIADKKGLEVTFLLSLCFFIDHLFPTSPSSLPAVATTSTPTPPIVPSPPSTQPSSSDSPRRQPQQQLLSPIKNRSPTVLATNEIRVESSSSQSIEEYCSRCLSLLEDTSLMFLILTPLTPREVTTVVTLSEMVKRKRYKASGEELKIFVNDDISDDEGEEVEEGMGTKVERKDKNYVPPQKLKIYLSRIEIGELLPTHQLRKKKTKGTTNNSNQPRIPPPLRPPINFDHPTTSHTPSSKLTSPSTSTATTKKMSSVETTAGAEVNGKSGRRWFGRT